LIVGSANSSNTVRLVEVALEAGAKAAYRIDYASEIQESWFEGVETVGVSSGASAPEELVDQVLEYLAERGYGGPTEITTAEEDVQFSLPKELRKDLKSAGQDTSNKVKRS
jgi:4-hydroxy-3-methylbut-2-enyl diphosphate reductase